MSKVYRAKVEQDGDEFALIFPDEFIKDSGWNIGDELTMFVDSAGTLCMVNATQKRE